MKVYPKNKIAASTVQMAHEINLGTDRRAVGLCDFSFAPGNFKHSIGVGDTLALIYCTLMDSQFVGEQMVACIRTYIYQTTFCNHVFKNVYYMPVKQRRFRNIRIKITDSVGKRIPFKVSKTPTKVVLHFRRLMYINTNRRRLL